MLTKLKYKCTDTFYKLFKTKATGIILALLLLIPTSWIILLYFEITYKNSIIDASQNNALSVIRNASFTIDEWYRHRIFMDKIPSTIVENELFIKFIKPISILGAQAILIKNNQIIFDNSANFDAKFRNKDIKEVFNILDKEGAKKYTNFLSDVINHIENKGWLYLPKYGKVYGAWTPLRVGKDTFMVCMLIPENKILDSEHFYPRLIRDIIATIVFNATLLFVWIINIRHNYLVRTYTKRLRNEVKERTKDLEKANKQLYNVNKKLKESNTLFLELTTHAQDGIIIINKQGNTVFWNKAATSIFGYTEEEMLNAPLHDFLVPPESKSDAHKGLHEFKSLGIGIVFDRLLTLNARTKDNKIITVELSISTVKIHEEWQAIGIVRDITQKKMMEINLRLNEEKYRSLYTNAYVGLFREKFEDGTLLECNSAYANMFKSDVLSMLSLNAKPRYVIQSDVVFYKEELLKNKEIPSIETLCITEDNEEFWIKMSLVLTDDGKYIDGVATNYTSEYQVKKQLVESRNQLTQLINLMPQVIYAKDEEGKFFIVNQAMADLFGTTIEDMIGKTEVYYIPNINAANKMLEDCDVLNGRPLIKPEELFTDRFGYIHYFETTKIPFSTITSKPAILVISNDITDRISLEKELKAKEEMISTVINASGIGYWDWFPIEDRHYLSESWYDLLDITPNDHINFYSLIHNEDIGYVIDALQTHHEEIKNKVKNSIYDVEFRIEMPDGSHKWIQSIGKIVELGENQEIKRISGVHIDINRRKQAELKQVQSDLRFQILSDLAPIMIMMHNHHSIIYANRAYREFVGKTLNELVGTNPFDSVYTDYKDSILKKSFDRINDNRVAIEQYETKLVGKDNIPIWIDVNASKIEYNGESAILSCLVNIEEKKNTEVILEQVVAQRTKQLHEVNEELQKFTGNVSHDLKNPIRAIDSFTQLLYESLDKNKLDQEQHEYFKYIFTSVSTVKTLITALYSLAQLTHRDIYAEVFNANEVANRVTTSLIASLDPSIAKKVHIYIHTNIIICCDKQMLEPVYQNLINNAIKFASHLECIQIEIGSFELNNDIVYFVCDNGTGFKEEYSDKIFEPLKRFNTNVEGIGIGLSTVKRIILKHDGKIWAESISKDTNNNHIGSCFYFILRKPCNEMV